MFCYTIVFCIVGEVRLWYYVSVIDVSEKTLQGYKFIDLFAGIGGFHLALSSLGAECVYASEWDSFAQKVYKDNFGLEPEGDITKVDESKIPDHDILCAGFPCQAFSISGKQRGFEDSRGTLFFDVARVVKKKKPKVVFMENVKNFATHDNGNTLSVVKTTMEQLGYTFYEKVLNAVNYGIPQKRERIYMVCFRNDLVNTTFTYPKQVALTKHVEDFLLSDKNLVSDLYIERDDTYYPPIQKEILSSAIDMLRPGGMIVYSTCTFSVKENEEVIQDALDRHPDIHLVSIPKCPGFSSGINMEECVRLYPHKIHGEGHFVALLQKDGDTPQKRYQNIKISLPESFKEFLNLCTFDFSQGSFIIKNEKAIWSPLQLPEQKKWRLLRSGLICGELKKNHFEPSQALALALKKEQFKNTVDLSVEDTRVIKYLKGETIDIKDLDTKTKGWILICVNGYPLGFGKIDKGIIKNKYAKGWRWQ